MSKDAAKEEYILSLHKNPLYGCAVFPVKGFGEMSNTPTALAVNWRGIHIINKETKVLYFLVNWRRQLYNLLTTIQ